MTTLPEEAVKAVIGVPVSGPYLSKAEAVEIIEAALPFLPALEPSAALPCTCHPDDNPPVPCAGKYALSDCRSAARELAFEEILRELSGNPRQLIDMMASAIRADGSDLCDGAWGSLSDDRALAVVKEYLTARLPASRTVTEAMELARTVLAQSITAGHNVHGPTPEDIEKAFWALDAALQSAMEAGR